MKNRDKLLTPVGINNFTGAVFKCFTRGDSLAFTFTFDANLDVTDWEVIVTFSPSLWCEEKSCSSGDLTKKIPIQVEIPLIDEERSIFKGTVADAYTGLLPCGLCYASAKYINESGITKIIDMCQLEVYPNIAPI